MKAAMAWALPQFSKVMKERPDSARPHLLAGLCSLSVGESEKAHSLLKEAVRLDPKSIAAHSALASVLRLTEIKAALDEAQRVVEVAPRYSTGHVDVGRTLLTMGRKREAIEELRRAVRLKPENLEAQIGLGVAYRRVKQYAESIEAFRRALAFKSNCARRIMVCASHIGRLGIRRALIASCFL